MEVDPEFSCALPSANAKLHPGAEMLLEAPLEVGEMGAARPTTSGRWRRSTWNTALRSDRALELPN